MAGLTMFEGLREIVKTQGDILTLKLNELRDTLVRVAEGTEAQLAVNQWVRKSIAANTNDVAQLRNDSAYGWLIRGVAATVDADLFIGVSSDDGFVGGLEARERDNVHWYLPQGSILFVENVEEGEGAENGFVVLEIEVLVTHALEAHTGKDTQHVDVPRMPTVPSGHGQSEV